MKYIFTQLNTLMFNFTYITVRQYDHTDNDCLCIIVLTHGLQNDLIWAKDVAYKSEKIWKPFTADKCTTLAGKPKLFFFQVKHFFFNRVLF